MINSTILNQNPVLAEIVQRLVRDFGPKRGFLFGSRARAKRDLEAGRKLVSTPDLSSQASFFSQQATEKEARNIAEKLFTEILLRLPKEGSSMSMCLENSSVFDSSFEKSFITQ